MRQITTRVDDDTEEAFGSLMALTGRPRLHVVRDVSAETRRDYMRAQLREEALRCRNDATDLAEAQAVAAEMESRRA
jgi:hypothetical protein